MFWEEDARTVNDGYSSLVGLSSSSLTSTGQKVISGVTPRDTGGDLLATRHSTGVHFPNDVYAPTDLLANNTYGVGHPELSCQRECRLLRRALRHRVSRVRSAA